MSSPPDKSSGKFSEKPIESLTGKNYGKATTCKTAACKLAGIFSGKALTVARHEFLKTVRRKEFLFMTFIFPLFFVLIALGPVLLAGISPPESHNIAYVDLSDSLDFSPEAADGVAEKFTETAAEDSKHLKPVGAGGGDGNGASGPGITFIRYKEVEEARRALESGEVSSYLVVPEDFLENGFVELYVLEKGEVFSGPDLSGRLSDIIVTSLLRDKVDESVLRRVRAPVEIRMFNFGENGEAEEQGLADILGDFGLPFVTSVLLFFSIFSASGYLLRGISEEKENRIIEVLLSSVSPLELLAGKVLGLGAVGLLQITVWVSAVALGATYTFPLGVEPFLLLLALVYFLLGYLVFSSLMAGVGAMTSSLQESQQLAGFFTFVAASPLVFMQVLLTDPNSPIPVFFSLFPLTSPVAMMARLAATDVPLYQIATSLIILIISIYGVVLFSSRLFRAYLLMYGKKLKLREIWRYMRTE